MSLPSSQLGRLGAQEPRVCNRGPASESDAADAVAMGGAYGLVADPWQEFVLHGWLAIGDDGLWAHPRCKLAVSRQNGKNATLELREVFGAALLGERILHTAHLVSTARKHFARLLHFFENPRTYPDLAAMVKDIRRANGQEAILLHNGGAIEIAARTKSSGRGFTVDLLVCDEDQELTDEEVEALDPTLSVSPNPQTILCGTPPDLTVLLGEVVYRWREAAIKGDDPRLCWDEWSVDADVMEGVDPKTPAVEVPALGDPELWAQANPSLGIRLREQTIADQYRSWTAGGFARERLGLWVPRPSGRADDWVIPELAWRESEDAGSEPVDPVAFAVDVTPARTASSISLAGARTDGRRHVEFIERRPGTKWLAARLCELARTWAPTAIVVDVKGGAATILPELHAELEAAGLSRDLVLEVSTAEYGQACQAMYDEATQDGLRHVGDGVLTDAVAAAQRRPMGDAWAWDRRDPAVDISPLVSASLALYGHIARPKAVESVYLTRGLLVL